MQQKSQQLLYTLGILRGCRVGKRERFTNCGRCQCIGRTKGGLWEGLFNLPALPHDKIRRATQSLIRWLNGSTTFIGLPPTPHPFRSVQHPTAQLYLHLPRDINPSSLHQHQSEQTLAHLRSEQTITRGKGERGIVISVVQHEGVHQGEGGFSSSPVPFISLGVRDSVALGRGEKMCSPHPTLSPFPPRSRTNK
ncbi:hypothetical protein CEXT_44171 [Caerostris extrusa]|uniref:Uncharacterized protein n=1 Tax=Caerostris extrusa TaxID=172846 RepID=A0AAV4YAU1_CAEEX|nr:hypothetical protein CEXT_44171 [Caerostris extrusa]